MLKWSVLLRRPRYDNQNRYIIYLIWSLFKSYKNLKFKKIVLTLALPSTMTHETFKQEQPMAGACPMHFTRNIQKNEEQLGGPLMPRACTPLTSTTQHRKTAVEIASAITDRDGSIGTGRFTVQKNRSVQPVFTGSIAQTVF